MKLKNLSPFVINALGRPIALSLLILPTLSVVHFLFCVMNFFYDTSEKFKRKRVLSHANIFILSPRANCNRSRFCIHDDFNHVKNFISKVKHGEAETWNVATGERWRNFFEFFRWKHLNYWYHFSCEGRRIICAISTKLNITFISLVRSRVPVKRYQHVCHTFNSRKEPETKRRREKQRRKEMF